MMVHFRKRFSEKDLKRINELIAKRDKAIEIEAVSSLRDDHDSDDCRLSPFDLSDLTR